MEMLVSTHISLFQDNLFNSEQVNNVLLTTVYRIKWYNEFIICKKYHKIINTLVKKYLKGGPPRRILILYL